MGTSCGIPCMNGWAYGYYLEATAATWRASLTRRVSAAAERLALSKLLHLKCWAYTNFSNFFCKRCFSATMWWWSNATVFCVGQMCWTSWSASLILWIPHMLSLHTWWKLLWMQLWQQDCRWHEAKAPLDITLQCLLAKVEATSYLLGDGKKAQDPKKVWVSTVQSCNLWSWDPVFCYFRAYWHFVAGCWNWLLLDSGPAMLKAIGGFAQRMQSLVWRHGQLQFMQAAFWCALQNRWCCFPTKHTCQCTIFQMGVLPGQILLASRQLEAVCGGYVQLPGGQAPHICKFLAKFCWVFEIDFSREHSATSASHFWKGWQAYMLDSCTFGLLQLKRIKQQPKLQPLQAQVLASTSSFSQSKC